MTMPRMSTNSDGDDDGGGMNGAVGWCKDHGLNGFSSSRDFDRAETPVHNASSYQSANDRNHSFPSVFIMDMKNEEERGGPGGRPLFEGWYETESMGIRPHGMYQAYVFTPNNLL